MSCILLDGKALAAQLAPELAEKVAVLKAQNGSRCPEKGIA